MVRIRHILVPTDFSEPAEAAWHYATDLAHEFQSGLHLLHVVPEPYVYPWGTELSTLPLAELLNEAEAVAKQRLAEIANGVAGAVAQVDFGTAIGPPVERILDYAGTRQIDLIVMGTHGRGTMGHLLLGSVVERVIRRATVPVLTVHGASGRTKAQH